MVKPPRRAGIVAVLLLVVSAALTAVPAGPASARTVSALRHHPAPPLPRMPSPRLHRPQGGSVYTILDIGAPSSTTYSYSYPEAFNNTGQFAGYGIDMTQRDRRECLGTSGFGFSPEPAAASFSYCNPASIGDTSGAGPSRTFPIVGVLETIYENEPVGFAATVTPATAGVSANELLTNVNSELLGVNVLGQAVGDYFYNPAGGFFTSQPPITYALSTRSAALLQPSCRTPAQGCLAAESSYVVKPCPFGGCGISNAGQVVGGDIANGDVEIYTISTGAAQDLTSIPLLGDAFALDLNSNDQLMFATYTPSSGNDSSNVYNISSGATTQIPPVSGDPNGCLTYYPLSLSNAGEVLGYTADCPSGSAFYFTWDPINGTQNLSNEFPVQNLYSQITPLGVNDGANILVALVPNSGGLHWGTLKLMNPVPGRRRRAITPMRLIRRP